MGVDLIAMDGNPMNATPACTMALLPDEDLVHRFRAGEQDAFSHLYTRYRRRVLSTVYRITRNADDAQDATQEIFLKLYRALPGWDSGRARFSTWLYRVAANHAIDTWRVRSRRQPTGEASENTPADERTPLVCLQESEALERVLRHASRLPRMQKRLFLHRYIFGRSLEEIARREGCSLGTVKGLLHRATHAVRRRCRIQ
jgi:RNA polymerase sigma-70 factor (ECF subfamily)